MMLDVRMTYRPALVEGAKNSRKTDNGHSFESLVNRRRLMPSTEEDIGFALQRMEVVANDDIEQPP